MIQKWLVIVGIGFFPLGQTAQADWAPVKRITWTSGYSNYPAIAADPSGNLHVVWQDYTPGKPEIYYANSTDGGASWSTEQRLTVTAGDSEWPAITADSSGHLHVVWGDATPGNAEIYYTASTDGGVAWTPIKRLTWNSGWSQYPAIAAAPSGGLYLAWEDSTPSPNIPEIYFLKSTDGGITWTSPKRLTWTSYSSTAPDIAVGSSGHLHLAWDDLILPANFEIYYKKSTDEGVTWPASRRFTWLSSGSFEPEIGVDSIGNVHVVWMEGAHGPFEIYYKKSTDEGATWSANKRLTWNESASVYPVIVADSSNNLHLVWSDSDPAEVYYRMSSDSGATWLPAKRLTWNSGQSERPDITADTSDNLHVVWQDLTPGSYEIYYRKFVK